MFKNLFEWIKEKWRYYHLWKCILVIFLFIFLIISTRLVFVAKTTNVKGLKYRLENPTSIYDSSGKKVGTLCLQTGKWVSLSDISPNVPNAVLSTEDRNFYHEYGFSIKGIIRAFIILVLNRLMGSDVISQGGSTITQQLVKNTFLSPKKTFSRKAKGIFLAMQLENIYSKNTILTMYLNSSYFGNDIWGIQNAAERYFGTSAYHLNIPESATLAGMLTNPNGFNPIDNLKASIYRRNVVLHLMYENHKITKSQMKKYQKSPMIINHKYVYHSSYCYPYYFDAVINEAINECGLTEKQIMTNGYKIYTTLNQNQQKVMQKVFSYSYLFPSVKNGIEAQAASIAINPHTGGVTALMGGRINTHVFRGYNRATQLQRSPGSTIKPLAVYTPALENGYYYDSTVDDILQSYGPKKYTPQNWNNNYIGHLPLWQALALSKNTSAVWLLNKIGVQKGFNSVEKFGIKLTKADDNLSLALGGLQKGVSPYQMASAYTAFADNGIRYTPHFITKIVNSSGKVIFNSKDYVKHYRVMPTKIAKEMTSIMIDVYKKYGTGFSASPDGYIIAGKTGSTQNSNNIYQNGKAEDDHWYIGYTNNIVVANWMGYDSNRCTLGEYGFNEGSGLFKVEMENLLPFTNYSPFRIKAASSMSSEISDKKGNGFLSNSKLLYKLRNIKNKFIQKIKKFKYSFFNKFK